MRDRPTPEELLKGARTVLDRDIAQTLEGGRRYDAILVSRAMAVATRAIANGNTSLKAEASRLANILGSIKIVESADSPHSIVITLNWELVERIRKGEFDGGAARQHLFDHLREVTRDKLAESNPKYFDQD